MDIIHPINLCDTIIPSNVFFAPINPGYSNNGEFSKQLFDFHVHHSGNDIGIYYVGNVSMHKAWSTNSNTVVLSTSETELWQRLTQKISANGSIPGIQLAWKPESISMQRGFIARDFNKQINAFREFYSSVEDLDFLASIYIDSIVKARLLGFKVIQLHGAHGYALSLLLSRSASNCQTPEETKGVALLKRIFKKLDRKDIILDIRVSLYEGIDDTQEEYDFKLSLFKILAELGFDIISLSNGLYNINKQMIYPPKKLGPVILREAVSIAEQHQDIVWNVSGNMEKVLFSRQSFPPNLSFSIGRQLFADPMTIVKIKNNTIDKINWCSECGLCHYYSHSLNGIQPCIISNNVTVKSLA